MREVIALQEGRTLLGPLVIIDEESRRAWTAVSSRPCCLAAIPVECNAGEVAQGVCPNKQVRRWFFTAQPISISQNLDMARQGQFVVLLDDCSVWRCSFALKRESRLKKRSKTSTGDSNGLSFAIETDARSVAAGAHDLGEAHKVANVRPGAKIVYAQEDRVVIVSWEHFGGPSLSFVTLQQPTIAEIVQPRNPCTPLGELGTVSCCAIIERQTAGKAAIAGATLDWRHQQHPTLEAALFDALFGHDACGSVLVVADGSSAQLAFASLGAHPRLQAMSSFFAQDEPTAHVLALSLPRTATSHSFVAPRTASSALLSLTATGAAVAFFLEQGGGGTLTSCRFALPVTPPLFSCCSIPLPYQEDGGENAGREAWDGGDGVRAASAVVWVGGDGARMVSVTYAAEGAAGARTLSLSLSLSLSLYIYIYIYIYICIRTYRNRERERERESERET
jgi:hypothetical protein